MIYNNVGEQKVAIGLTNAAVRVRGCTRFKVHIISLSLELALPVSVQPAYCLHRLYLSLEDKFDKEHGDSWSGSMDVLVFVHIRITFRGLIHRLFSATVATSIVASYPNLQPNSSDTTVLLLAQISQQLATLANGPPSPSAVTLPDATAFQPTASAVRVNTLWFISLNMSSMACKSLIGLTRHPNERAYVRTLLMASKSSHLQRQSKCSLFSCTRVALLRRAHRLSPQHQPHRHLYYDGAHRALPLSVFPAFHHAALLPQLTLPDPLSAVFWFILEVAPLVRLWFVRRSEAVQRSMLERREKIAQGMRRALEKTAANLT